MFQNSVLKKILDADKGQLSCVELKAQFLSISEVQKNCNTCFISFEPHLTYFKS